jgi:DNA-binding MarR family transcriptional regulator
MANPPVGYSYVVKQLELALRPKLVEACAAEGLTAAQYTALTVLDRRPGITSSELARRSFVRAQTMAMTLDPLLETGLVRREQDAAHGRRKALYLTPAGADAIARLAPRVNALEEVLVSDLSTSERVAFIDYLRRARRAMEQAGDGLRAVD